MKLELRYKLLSFDCIRGRKMKNNSSKLYPASKKNTSEIEKLKREISLVELVKSDGLSPKKQGKNYVMLCPFHDDSNASFSITP